jgi:hypothetical protein
MTESKIVEFVIFACSSFIGMVALFIFLASVAVKSERSFKEETNRMIAHGLLDSDEPRWSGRSKSDPNVRKVGRA